MKNRNILIAALLLVAAVLNQRVDAQVSGSTADVPRIMSYQGQITSTNGNAMNGTHTITATLYSDPHGTHSLWKGNYNAEVKNGIFNIMLGSGVSKLPDNSEMNQPLWVGIKVDDGAEMQPLTQLAAAPYALNVPDQSITLAKLAPEVVFEMSGGHSPTTQGYGTNWLTDGNSFASAGTPILGTLAGTTQKNWETQVNGKSIWHFEDPGGDPNIRADNSTISGNGSVIIGVNTGSTHSITGDYSIIGVGGNAHVINANYSAIMSGWNNEIINSSHYSFIGGEQ